MPISTQFELGLELTNVFNPISQAISALGSLAIVDAIKKSGSDVVTELKLASLIGRHRIDPIIAFHFREAVSIRSIHYIEVYGHRSGIWSRSHRARGIEEPGVVLDDHTTFRACICT